jgi:hypothetical protein
MVLARFEVVREIDVRESEQEKSYTFARFDLFVEESNLRIVHLRKTVDPPAEHSTAPVSLAARLADLPERR